MSSAKQLFANVLADEDNRLAASLKKAANNKVFDHIKKSLIESEVRRIVTTKTKKETFAIRTEICQGTRLLMHQLIS